MSNVHLEALIRTLRNELYWKTQHRYAHEREWETEEKEQERDERNKECRDAWDEATEELIRRCYEQKT